MLKPVAFPPGRARLSTSPAATGSPTTAITIGIVRVVALRALAAGVPPVTMTSTPLRTRSAASPDSVSGWSYPHFHSIAIVLPSTNPSSLNPSRNAFVRGDDDAGAPGRRTPIRGIFRDCCAWICNGHIVVPTTNRIVKSRRLIWRLASDASLQVIVSPQPTLLKGANARFGSKAVLARCPRDFRFTLNNDPTADIA